MEEHNVIAVFSSLWWWVSCFLMLVAFDFWSKICFGKKASVNIIWITTTKLCQQYLPLFHFLQLFTTALGLYREWVWVLRKYYVVTCHRQPSLFPCHHSGHDRIWQKVNEDMTSDTFCIESSKCIVLPSFRLFDITISWSKKYT